MMNDDDDDDEPVKVGLMTWREVLTKDLWCVAVSTVTLLSGLWTSPMNSYYYNNYRHATTPC